MSVKIDIKEKLSYEEFKKQFGHFFKYSNAEMKEKKIKQAYAETVKKFPVEEKRDIVLDKATDIPVESNKEYPIRERRKKEQE